MKTYTACNHVCTHCGNTEKGTWADGLRKELQERVICFHCEFWRKVTLEKNNLIVIKGWAYNVGDEPSKDFLKRGNRSLLGMSGRRFDIHLHGVETFTTHNLWSRGEIPQLWQPKLPDNAEFVTGGRAQVHETTCWDPADPKTESYPSLKELFSKKYAAI